MELQTKGQHRRSTGNFNTGPSRVGIVPVRQKTVQSNGVARINRDVSRRLCSSNRALKRLELFNFTWDSEISF